MVGFCTLAFAENIGSWHSQSDREDAEILYDIKDLGEAIIM